jgi:hypothetical protein
MLRGKASPAIMRWGPCFATCNFLKPEYNSQAGLVYFCLLEFFLHLSPKKPYG